MFQSLTGRLQTYEANLLGVTRLAFQSLTGRLQTQHDDDPFV